MQASDALSRDDEYPKGFYLRVVDGRAWLRGYRCDDGHSWSPDDRFIFQLPPCPLEFNRALADRGPRVRCATLGQAIPPSPSSLQACMNCQRLVGS